MTFLYNMMKRYKGKFIVLEGGECVGKTTQCALLDEKFKSQNTLLTREPGGTPLAEEIRNLLLNSANEYQADTELLLHFAARNEHLQNVIIPHLEIGGWVICDRYVYSTLAYQIGGCFANKDLFWKLSSEISIEPNLIIILSASDDVIQKRLNKKDKLDRYESAGELFHKRVRNQFEKLSDMPNTVCINTDNQTIEQVHERILEEIEARRWIKP